MKTKRSIQRVDSPRLEPGFMGNGHTARAVIQVAFAQSDPFILLMDDMLDKKDDSPAGGPHPHAGFETVTLMIEGELGVGEHIMESGDLQMMTAGSGIIHTETIEKKTKLRLLQLWLILPKKDRWTEPRVQDIKFEQVPKTEANGVQIRLYSGEFAGLKSPLKNYVPVIIADILLQSGASLEGVLPAGYNGFVYAIQNSVTIGATETILKADQVGWLNRPEVSGDSELTITAGDAPARVILYAGQPQGDPIVSHGPFIADTQEDIRRLYSDYRSGKLQHISEVPETQKLAW